MIEELLLLNKIREGDIKAFEQVFRLYYSPLTAYATRLVRDEDSAEEIVQQLFYVLWKDHAALRVFQSLKSYLYKAVRNGALQWMEHQEIRRRYSLLQQEKNNLLLGSENHSDSGAPQQEMEYKELETFVSHTLDHLPERRRAIFKLNRYEGKSYSEIAGIYAISVKTVEAEMSKALDTFRKEIKNYMNR